jgi:AsmA protein
MPTEFTGRAKPRRVLIAAAAITALVGLGSIRWPVAAEAVMPKLQQALEASSGYRIETAGAATFQALPWPSLQIAGLSFSRPGAAHERLDVSLVKARLNVASWIVGRPRLVSLAFFDPKLRLGSSERVSETEAASAVLGLLAPERRSGLRSLRIERGAVEIDGRSWLDDVRLTVSDVGGSALRLSASGNQNGAALAIEAEAGSPDPSGRRPVRWTAAAPAFNLHFDGQLLAARSLDAEGRLAVAIAEGKPLADRLNIAPEHASLLDGLAVSGRARLAWPVVQLREARIERGAMRLRGSLEMSAGGRVPAFAATLDAESFDLEPLLAPLADGLRDRGAGWSTEPFRTAWLNAAAFDLRLSAGRMTAGGLTLDAAALSAQLGGGRLDVALSDGRLRSGSVKGRLSLTAQRGDSVDIRAQASADRIEAAQAAEWLGIGRFRGLASLQFGVEGSGGTLAQFVTAARGRAEAVIRDGELPGLDLDRVAMRAERIAGGAPPPDGRTRFSALTLRLRLQDGKAMLHDSSIITPAVRTPVEGAVALDSRSFDVTLRPQSSGEPNRAGVIRLRLEGPWSNPILAPDATGRTNRS